MINSFRLWRALEAHKRACTARDMYNLTYPSGKVASRDGGWTYPIAAAHDRVCDRLAERVASLMVR